MPSSPHPNSFGAASSIEVDGSTYEIFSLSAPGLDAAAVAKLPFSIKILLENMLRHEDGVKVAAAEIEAVSRWADEPSSHGSGGSAEREIAFSPERVLMQDFTGVPAVVDLAAMRDAIVELGGDPAKINPLVPVELVIDHSIIVENSGASRSLDLNVAVEYQRNAERYQLLKWAQGALDDFLAVPPGIGICHQVNLEHLARVVFARGGQAFFDTVVGTDSHTTMVNGLGVLGWGVGGIEAEAAMLGQPTSMLIPPVVGLKLTGSLKPGVTATDLVLTITEALRKHGVVGKFVEAFGPGVAELSLETRATISNMTPEYGATCTIFPIDHKTTDYLRFTGRDETQISLVEAYAKAQGIWHKADAPDPVFTSVVELELGDVVPSLAGPARPQDRVDLSGLGERFRSSLGREVKQGGELFDGAITVAAITSCTNTSNPQVLVAAGLLAKAAAARGLRPKPWVKTSLAPGSRVVMDYLERAQLVEPLEALGFYLVGYGCTTCIGNTGPLLDGVSELVHEHDLSVAAVLSGNRNFEGRIHPDVKMNFLASPPLVVAFALAGTVDIDLSQEPLGIDSDGKPVMLSEIWPSDEAVSSAIRESLDPEMFASRYASATDGDAAWKGVKAPSGAIFDWDEQSTYVLKPPYFAGMAARPSPVSDIDGARVLAVLGDSVTTDHISPAGSIGPATPAAAYLGEHGVSRQDFNSYGARRGNHEAMMRGTFANVRLRNQLAPGTEGGITRHLPDGEQTSIFEASERYRAEGVPLIVLAGKEYGSGSSRDWAAKGPALLGVKAVIAQSYERIHRSNLVGMGVVPLEFPQGESASSLGLDGEEVFSIDGLEDLNTGILPRVVEVSALHPNGHQVTFEARVRIDTETEADYYRHGGVLQFVLRQLAQQ